MGHNKALFVCNSVCKFSFNFRNKLHTTRKTFLSLFDCNHCGCKEKPRSPCVSRASGLVRLTGVEPVRKCVIIVDITAFLFSCV